MIASIVWWPGWLSSLLAVVFLCTFPSYYEILVWGILSDALYGIRIAEFWGLSCFFSIVSIALFVCSLVLRNILIAHEPTI